MWDVATDYWLVNKELSDRRRRARPHADLKAHGVVIIIIYLSSAMRIFKTSWIVKYRNFKSWFFRYSIFGGVERTIVSAVA